MIPSIAKTKKKIIKYIPANKQYQSKTKAHKQPHNKDTTKENQ